MPRGVPIQLHNIVEWANRVNDLLVGSGLQRSGINASRVTGVIQPSQGGTGRSDGSALVVEEIDGSPSIHVTKIKVRNGEIQDDTGGVITLLHVRSVKKVGSTDLLDDVEIDDGPGVLITQTGQVLTVGVKLSSIIIVNGNGDYTTVSSALAAATSGDTIVITPGTYIEGLLTIPSGVNLVGLDPATTVLGSPTNQSGPVFTFVGNNKVSGLKFRSTASSGWTRELIRLQGSVEFSGCVFEFPYAEANETHYVIRTLSSPAGSLFMDNCEVITTTQGSGGSSRVVVGIRWESTTQGLFIRNSLISMTHNGSGHNRGVWMDSSSPPHDFSGTTINVVLGTSPDTDFSVRCDSGIATTTGCILIGDKGPGSNANPENFPNLWKILTRGIYNLGSARLFSDAVGSTPLIVRRFAAQTAALVSVLKEDDSVIHQVGADGSIVFNDQGDNADIRVEGTADPNLFFVDASSNNIGVGTSTPNVNASFDNAKDKPQLLPRVTTDQRDSVTPSFGMVIYNTSEGKFQGYQGTAWIPFDASHLRYRQFVYEVSGGSFTFIKDDSGNPVMTLEELE